MVAITDINANIISQQRYLPFGQVRTDVSSPNPQSNYTDFVFTGQRAVSGLDLMDYHARMYDSLIGRFISPDTIIPSMANPQSWNRYSYVLNDPVNFTDPSGQKYCDDADPNDCVSGNPIVGSINSKMPSTLADFRRLNWQQRKVWLQGFAMSNNLGNWFNDMEGAIDFMSNDNTLQVKGGIAEVMDAGVLQAINDGWLAYSSGQTIANGGGRGWLNFFSQVDPLHSNGNQPLTSNSSQVSARLAAEQAGVDYAQTLPSVQEAISNAGEFEQIDFGNFLGSANLYRWADRTAINLGSPLYLDPRKDGPFLLGASALIAPFSWSEFSITAFP